MKDEKTEKIMKWLDAKPSLDDLGVQFPELVEIVRREIAEIVADGNTTKLPEYLKRMAQTESLLKERFRYNSGDNKNASLLQQQAVRTRMAHLAVKQHLIAEATGIEKGKVRFNLLNGYIAQKLLFADGLERKPVSMFWFRLIWPLLPQRRLLMPLVQPEGIYCFYSQQLVDEIAALIASRNCLEIAAGEIGRAHV